MTYMLLTLRWTHCWIECLVTETSKTVRLSWVHTQQTTHTHTYIYIHMLKWHGHDVVLIMALTIARTNRDCGLCYVIRRRPEHFVAIDSRGRRWIAIEAVECERRTRARDDVCASVDGHTRHRMKDLTWIHLHKVCRRGHSHRHEGQRRYPSRAQLIFRQWFAVAWVDNPIAAILLRLYSTYADFHTQEVLSIVVEGDDLTRVLVHIVLRSAIDGAYSGVGAVELNNVIHACFHVDFVFCQRSDLMSSFATCFAVIEDNTSRTTIEHLQCSNLSLTANIHHRTVCRKHTLWVGHLPVLWRADIAASCTRTAELLLCHTLEDDQDLDT